MLPETKAVGIIFEESIGIEFSFFFEFYPTVWCNLRSETFKFSVIFTDVFGLILLGKYSLPPID
jgi:hypothetical protein